MKPFKRQEDASPPKDLARKLSQALGRELALRKLALGTAESCSGGLIAHLLTNIPGSSSWFAGAVVAYANAAKIRVLGVPEVLIAEHGAVSKEVVLAMARGVQGLLGTHAALAVSGIAGPGGGSPEKPVGTVWIAWVLGDAACSERFLFSGTRLQIKRQTATVALEGMMRMLTRL